MRDLGILRRWGFGAWVMEVAQPGVEIGRVVRVDRGECDVITAQGLVRVGSDSVRAQAETAPVTGDWVELVEGDGQALISRVLPRRTSLNRRDPAERDSEQVLAANADVVGIVAALDRPLVPGRFERLLVMSLNSGASILVVLTKSDRVRSAAKAESAAEMARDIVGDIPVVLTSVLRQEGLDTLQDYLGPGRTLALVGASGSGKSSLVNVLAGAEVVATGKVRPSDARGRHTTVTRELVLLPDDMGLVLDTPGLRSLGLWDAEEALQQVFGDISELAVGCRFDDCAHDSEPDCAVQAAIIAGDLSRNRVERARVLQDELKQQRLRASRKPRRR